MSENVKLKEGFEQVCIWPGVTMGNKTPDDFIKFMSETFSVRVQYLEEIETKPDRDTNFQYVPGTGGRIDQIFTIHEDDVEKFAGPRLQFGIRWIEDALSLINNKAHIYPERFKDYMSWDPN